jgi:hypothetical protein
VARYWGTITPACEMLGDTALFTDLAQAHGEGRLPRLMSALERTRLSIIDDWGPEPLNAEQRRDLLVEHRKALAAGLVTESASQPRLADTGRANPSPTGSRSTLELRPAVARPASSAMARRLLHRSWTADPKRPVDLPLRLDDAHASPTTPQVQRRNPLTEKKRKKSQGSARVRQRSGNIPSSQPIRILMADCSDTINAVER